MANFDLYFPKIKKHEGGYANVAGDKGGETYFGITRKNFPTWSGWVAIDALKAKAPIRRNTFLPTLEPYVKSFYLDSFWNRVKASTITSQPVAELYVDWLIHSGNIAISKVIETLKEMGATTINGANAQVLHNKLIEKRTNFFKAIVARNPTQSKFLAGWLTRVNSFAKDVPQATSIAGTAAALIAGFFLLNLKYKWIK